MKYILCLLVVLCPFFSKADGLPLIKPLKIGDRVPDIYFNHILNYPATKGPFSKIKKKYTLIDFWATTCGSCIHKFPLLDSMQRAYRGELAVLLISSSPRDTKEKVEKLFRKLNQNPAKPLTMPVMLGDTRANALLPHIYVPHYAWVGADGKIAAITGEEAVTAEHLQGFVCGEPLAFPVKEDRQDAAAVPAIYQSQLMAFIPGLAAGTRMEQDSLGGISSLLISNQPVLTLLKFAYALYVHPSLQHIAAIDSSVLISMPVYSYQQISPARPLAIIRVRMQEDLERYFGYRITSQKMPTPCYRLLVDSSLLKKSAAGSGENANSLAGRPPHYFRNRPLSDLAEYLEKTLPLPFIRSYDFRGKISISLPDELPTDFNGWQQILAVYGIYLMEDTAELSHYFIYNHPPN